MRGLKGIAEMEKRKEIKGKHLKQQTACHRAVAQFTVFWPIMFYSTISDGTVVSCDLISQLISLSNVNTKAKAEPLAASSAHPSLLMHNWLPWKEAREGKQPAIILTPVSRNWNPLTISARMIEVVLETRGMLTTWAAFCACCMEAQVCIMIWGLCLISVLTLKQRSSSLSSALWASVVSL